MRTIGGYIENVRGHIDGIVTVERQIKIHEGLPLETTWTTSINRREPRKDDSIFPFSNGSSPLITWDFIDNRDARVITAL